MIRKKHSEKHQTSTEALNAMILIMNWSLSYADWMEVILLKNVRTSNIAVTFCKSKFSGTLTFLFGLIMTLCPNKGVIE